MDQIAKMSDIYDVTVLTKTEDIDFLIRRGIRVKILSVPLERKIDLLRDLWVLVIIFRHFLRNKYDIVHTVTPKAGLIGMTAAKLAGIRVRIHTFTGQVWGTRRGIVRTILRFADGITSFMATIILADSSSQLDYIVAEGVVSKKKARVLGKGSISGVNTIRFDADSERKIVTRQKYGIHQDAFLFLYMARLTRDKGAIVMALAFAEFSRNDKSSYLLIVGPDEEQVRPAIREICAECIDRVVFVDFVSDPENYMAAADVFCMPSFREGFGTAMINASSVGIPVLASRIYGSIDAVEDGVTGFLFEPGNDKELAALMQKLKCDAALCRNLGLNGRKRTIEFFSEEKLTAELLQLYKCAIG
jgi:glycosyltransferase involved in cell wall biosynthesis